MDNQQAEIWARCNRWVDYEASSLGRVRRWRGGKVVGEPLLLKQHYHTMGYLMVQVSDASRAVKKGDAWNNVGGHRQIGVHRLVADAFLGPCPKNHEVNHKDLVKDNNRAENLEYVTHKENLAHAIRLKENWLVGVPCYWNGRTMPEDMRRKMSEAKRGARHPRARLVNPEEIKRLYNVENLTMQSIADKLGVSRTCVGDVIRGTHWTVGGYRTNRRTA